MSRSEDDDYARELRDERNDRFGDELQHAGAEHGKPQPLSVAAAPRPRQPESVEGMVETDFLDGGQRASCPVEGCSPAYPFPPPDGFNNATDGGLADQKEGVCNT